MAFFRVSNGGTSEHVVNLVIHKANDGSVSWVRLFIDNQLVYDYQFYAAYSTDRNETWTLD